MSSGSTNNEKALEVRTHDIPIAEAMTDFMMQGWAPSPLTGITAHSSIPSQKYVEKNCRNNMLAKD